MIGVLSPICEKTFEIPLNVEEPWYIKDYKLDSVAKILDIWLDFRRGSKFPCPKCGKPNCSAYDLSLIHISEPTRLGMISYAVFCLKKKKKTTLEKKQKYK